jgi:hypothetical protein
MNYTPGGLVYLFIIYSCLTWNKSLKYLQLIGHWSLALKS